jgi:hypothetical protein
VLLDAEAYTAMQQHMTRHSAAHSKMLGLLDYSASNMSPVLIIYPHPFVHCKQGLLVQL